VQQLFGQSSGQYYYGDCVKFEGDKDGVVQPQEDVHYGQSVILNVKTRKLFVKLVNASDKEKEADINLSRFPIKKNCVKTVISGNPDDENNFDKQPIAPQKETIKAEKKFDIDLKPYSMVMLEYQL
jgi:alpha-L-arabinofuranosidase